MTNLFDPRTVVPVLIATILGFVYAAIDQCSCAEYDASSTPPEMSEWVDENWMQIESILGGEKWRHNYPKMIDRPSMMISIQDCTDRRLSEIREEIKSIPSEFPIMVVAIQNTNDLPVNPMDLEK